MGNTDSTLSGMNDAQRVMNAIPILGGAFQMQEAATKSGVSALNGFGSAAGGLGGLLGNNPMLIIGGGVLLLIILK